MQRREFILIGVGGAITVPGCLTVDSEIRTETPSGGSNAETDTSERGPEPTREVVVSERVFSRGEIFNFDASEGDTIHVTVDNEAGLSTFVSVMNPSDEFLVDEMVETKESFAISTDETGVHRIDVAPDSRASVEVAIES